MEAARTTSAINEQRIAAASLLGTVVSLERQLAERGLSAEQTASLEVQLAAAIKQVADLGPEYKKSIEEGTEALKERLQLQLVQAQTEAWVANAQLVQLRKVRDEAAKPRVIPGQGVGRLAREPRVAVDTARLETANAALETQQALVNTLQGDVAKLEDTLTKALEVPATIKPRRAAKTDEQLNRDINDAVQRAQAELEALREFNARSRDIVNREVENGLTSAISQIEQEKQMALTELSAEMAVAQAQLVAARRRRVEGKVSPDLGAIEAAEIRIQSLIQQRFTLEQETEGKRTALRKEQAAARAKIEEDHLRAVGRSFEAARLEIERKFQEQLTKAIREFGEGSEEVIKLRVVIDQETMREQAEAAQEQIRRIEEARDQEVENARFRILGPVDETGNRRRGTAGERQQIADAVAAANERAVASAAPLLGALIEIRDHATDPMTENFVQSLINDLHELGRRAKEVDLELRRLKEGVGEALVSGLSGFLETLTDTSKNVATSFREMVQSILSDIDRLVSRLLAEKIIFSLFGIGGAATGGQAGNLTQSSGRATGGLARPPHGELHGGVPGVDSIHIAAMPKEYFIQTKAVDYYGAELFDLLNKMQLPRISPRSFRPMALGGRQERRESRMLVRRSDRMCIITLVSMRMVCSVC